MQGAEHGSDDDLHGLEHMRGFTLKESDDPPEPCRRPSGSRGSAGSHELVHADIEGARKAFEGVDRRDPAAAFDPGHGVEGQPGPLTEGLLSEGTFGAKGVELASNHFPQGRPGCHDDRSADSGGNATCQGVTGDHASDMAPVTCCRYVRRTSRRSCRRAFGPFLAYE
jgi:hypothetical protein